VSTRLDSLAAIDDAIWQELTRAVGDKQHPWRAPVLATTDGDSADARTVILREAVASERRLRLYTDQRAHKVAQLLSHPKGTLVMWSPTLAWQLRCHVHLNVLPQGLDTSSRWARVQHTRSEQDYMAPLAPGSVLDSAPTAGGIHRAHFAVIEADVISIDWLELHRDGHRRVVVDADGARWVQP